MSFYLHKGYYQPAANTSVFTLTLVPIRPIYVVLYRNICHGHGGPWPMGDP